MEPEERRRDLEAAVAAGYRDLHLDPERGLERIRSWNMTEKLATILEVELERLGDGEIRVTDREKPCRQPLAVPALGRPVILRGRIDRVESQAGLRRVVDYKTGAAFPAAARPEAWPDLQGLERRDTAAYLEIMAEFRRRCPPFQLLLYAQLLALEEKLEGSALDALYLFLKEPEPAYGEVFRGPGRNQAASPGRRLEIMTAFRAALESILADLFLRPDFPANPLDETECETCPYGSTCGAV